MNVETMKRLKAVLAERESVDIGNFQLINLDMVRAEAGERWDELRKKIYTAAGHFIEKRLGAEDVIVRCKGGFIIVYANRTGVEAARQTEAISLDLNRFFLGDRILRQLEVSSKTHSVSMAELASMVAGGQEEEAADNRAAKSARTPAERPMGDSAGNWQEIDHETGTGPVVAVSRSGDTRHAPATASSACADRPARAPSSAAKSDLADMAEKMMVGSFDLFSDLDKVWDDIVFLPAWDSRSGYFTSNFCLARRQHNGRTLYGRKTLLGKSSPELHRLLDHSVAIAAQRGFMRRYAEGVTCSIVIPVNYDTIVKDADRVRYFSILQCMPQHVRRYFYIRVDNIPDGAPMGQMEELFRAMRCFGSNILAKIPLGTVHLDRFENCGVTLFSSELPDPDRNGGIRDGVVRGLESQAISIQRHGARIGLTRVATHTQLETAIKAGFEVFTGDAIGAPMARPMPLRPCLLDELGRPGDAA